MVITDHTNAPIVADALEGGHETMPNTVTATARAVATITAPELFKVCPDCGMKKPADDFTRSSKTKDGLHT